MTNVLNFWDPKPWSAQASFVAALRRNLRSLKRAFLCSSGQRESVLRKLEVFFLFSLNQPVLVLIILENPKHVPKPI